MPEAQILETEELMTKQNDLFASVVNDQDRKAAWDTNRENAVPLEDIIDTGATMRKLLATLSKYKHKQTEKKKNKVR